MAHIRERSGKYFVEVQKNGIRKAATFRTKAEAKNWAAQTESDILAMKIGNYSKHTFLKAIDRYLKEISPQKKSYAKEKLRFEMLKRDFPQIVKKPLSEVAPADIAFWRDTRLKSVSNATVLRELSIIGNLFTVARKEWGWCGESPIPMIKKPSPPAPRERRITPSEVKKICRQLGYVTGRIETKSQEVALVFLIALRTGMRSGEILDLNKDRVNFKDRVLIVPHKTQHITGRERKIPITRHTVRLLGYLEKRGYYFTVDDKSRDALFRKAKKAQKIKDLHFHDSRAEALTRLAKKVDVMTLAKISGHKDLKILFNTYYRETAEDIAKRL